MLLVYGLRWAGGSSTSLHHSVVARFFSESLNSFVRRSILLHLFLVHLCGQGNSTCRNIDINLLLHLNEQVLKPVMPESLFCLHALCGVNVKALLDEVNHLLLFSAQHHMKVSVFETGTLRVIEFARENHLIQRGLISA